MGYAFANAYNYSSKGTRKSCQESTSKGCGKWYVKRLWPLRYSAVALMVLSCFYFFIISSFVWIEKMLTCSVVLLWINYHGATMRLYEPAIHMRTPRLQTNPVASIRRAEALWGCLEAAKDFFATYATIPLDMLGSMPLTATAYMSFATVTSSMILLLEDPDWDVNLARKTFDFAAACHNLGSRFREGDQIIQSLGRRRRFEENGKSTLEANYNKIMWIRQWYSSKISTLLAAEPTPRSSSQHPPPVIQQTDASVTQSIHADQSPLQDSCLLPLDLDAEFWHAMLDSHALTEWTD